jgi:hypothetical protein
MHGRVAAILVSLAACAACASSADGPLFAGFESIPPGSARLYVYNSHNPAVWISVNGRELSELRYGGYVSVVLAPGKYHLDAEGSDWRSRRLDPTERDIRLNAGDALVCEYWVEKSGPPYPYPGPWATKLNCTETADDHPDLPECRRDTVLEDALWQP